MTEPIWKPDPISVDSTAIVRFARWARDEDRARLQNTGDYAELWRWSTSDSAGFWRAVADFYEVHFATEPTAGLLGEWPGDGQWFPGATLNYAREVLDGARTHDGAAAILVSETGDERTVTLTELRDLVGSVAAVLTDAGVGQGDVVVGYLPNGLEGIVGLLASASIGAVWAQCGLDYAASAALDRFTQLRPRALIAATSTQFGGRVFDKTDEVRLLHEGLEDLAVTIVEGSDDGIPGSMSWAAATSRPQAPTYIDVPFEAPLWVLFTSGTTGLPKGIVHGHGGIVLEQLAFNGLHFDIGPGDRMFWYSSPNWVMWNITVSSLMLGGTVVMYDGSPSYPDVDRLWELAGRHRVKVFGTSPGYVVLCIKNGARPAASHDLEQLRIIGSTGSILPPSSGHWLRDEVGARVQINSISGGTDVAGGFAGSAPTTPVWAGELSAPTLGAALAALGADGTPVAPGEVGELAILGPMPSMPIHLWNDPDGQRYHETYFADLPGAWRQGDWITVTDRGSIVMHGRSDATLNRQGVRLGSADIYRVVEDLDEVLDSLVLGIELPDGGYWMPLFVALRDGVPSESAQIDTRIKSAIRTHASPRHVPDEIIYVERLPHTKTGKKLEVPLKRVLQGAAVRTTLSDDAVDEPLAVREVLEAARSRRAARDNPGPASSETSVR